MRRVSIHEYDDETYVEVFDNITKKRVEYKFETWDEAIEAIPNLKEI